MTDDVNKIKVGGGIDFRQKACLAASNVRADEYYTQFEDVENELNHYKEKFAGKVIYCNCDDPFESNFIKYFILHFNEFKIKKLIATCYSGTEYKAVQLSLFEQVRIKKSSERKSYKLEIKKVENLNLNSSFDLINGLLKTADNSLNELKGNGSFMSAECVEILKTADIVVTNPPFSFFRSFMDLLIINKKDFIVLGNSSALAYSNIFDLTKVNIIKLGYYSIQNGSMLFIMPDEAENFYKIKDIKIWSGKTEKRKLKNVKTAWLTTLDCGKRRGLKSIKKYIPEMYKKYDNFDAIEVGCTNDIPIDYDGLMGVPITFFNVWNPAEFEIIDRKDDLCIMGKKLYKRLIIQRK